MLAKTGNFPQQKFKRLETHYLNDELESVNTPKADLTEKLGKDSEKEE